MELITILSTTVDGSMKSADQNYTSVLPARTAFLKKYELDPTDTTLVRVTYETEDFCRYQVLSADDKGDGITRPAAIDADALVVTEPNHALFLPLADCVGAVIHDPVNNTLMVSHLGRHNLEQLGGTKCVEYLANHCKADPSNLTVWLSPAAGGENYPLHAFGGRSLQDVTVEQLTAAGVPLDHIDISPIDTTTHTAYFSHSEFLKGNRDNDGRFAIVAIMR